MKYLLLFIAVSFSANSEDKRVFIVEFYDEPLSVLYGTELSSNKADESKDSMHKLHSKFIEKLLKKSSHNKQKTLSVKHEYFHAINGLALELSEQQLQWLAQQDEIKSIHQERFYRINTDVGPSWIGADSVWNGLSMDKPPNRGEGVVVGIIDTGINPSHPSFQEVSQAGTVDQYSHTNPRARTYGLCTTQTCNDKLIGIYDFTDEGTAGIDTVGHGSHVAGIATGNVYSTNYLGLDFEISGVAPRANLISYKACFYSEEASGGRCSSSALLAAIDQATADRVEVVNYSIGAKTPCSPWGGLDNNGSFCGSFSVGLEAVAMLNARESGVIFVVSAGNNGPSDASIGYPAVAPWVLAVANTTHSRQLQSSVVDFSGGVSSLDELVGASATAGIGRLKIVHARDYGNALCGQGDPELKSKCNGTGNDVLTGASNPFAANTFNGEIVVCDRGSYGRIEKGFNVLQAGAAGYILANTVGQQESIVADNHCLPATHLGNVDGSKLRNWLESGQDHRGRITGQTLVYDEALGDILNTSSSRGPTEIVYSTAFSSGTSRKALNYMKPNISAPGTSIISAGANGSELATLTGTSMAAPHVAGAVALLKAAHPNYGPAEIISSLSLTADNSRMLKEDKKTKAEFIDQGAGRTQVDQAVSNSLYLDVTREEFIAANPQNGGQVQSLNLPELVNDNCYPSCNFSRRVKLLNSYNVVNPVWQVSIEQNNGLNITVEPSQFDFNSTEVVELDITVNTTANDVIGDWAEAKIVFTVTSSTASNPLLDTIEPAISKLPVAVFVPAGDFPELIERSSETRHGKFSIDMSNIASMSEATYTGLGPKSPQVTPFSLLASNGTPVFNSNGEYNNNGSSSFYLLELSTEKLALMIEAVNENSVDLYIGRDININDTPDEYEVLCHKSAIVLKGNCLLTDVVAGKYWVLIHNSASNINSNGFTNLVTFDLQSDKPQHAFFQFDLDFKQGKGLYIQAPVKTQNSTQLQVSYELPSATSENGSYYGLIAVGADANSVGKTAVIPVKINANEATNEKLYSLNNETADFRFSEGEKLSHMFFDTSPAVATASFYSFDVPYQLNLYRTDLDFDPLNLALDLTGLTADITVSSHALPVGTPPPANYANNEIADVDLSAYPPSRWYVEVIPSQAENSVAPAGYFAFKLIFTTLAEEDLIQPVQSLWYNPQRSGWGIDLSQTQTYQAVTWYRYSDDGTRPIWYQAVGELTNRNIWRGEMNLIRWNGEQADLQNFGSISLLYLDSNKAIMTVSMPDKTYSEPITALYSPNLNCPQVNANSILDVTGLWYLPEHPGYGSTVLATETTETTLFYFYDDDGLPIWAVGNRTFDTAETVMQQAFNGFCPDCEYSLPTFEDIGLIQNTYENEAFGSTSAIIELLPPLVGQWQSSGDSQKINLNFGCIIAE